MSGEEQLKAFSERSFQKTCTKVNDRIYHFLGYGLSNATAILGDTSVILVDALDSPGYALEMRAELARITDKPVKTIVFTHGHPDHCGGSGVFRDTAAEVIAFSPRKPMPKYYNRLIDVLQQRSCRQFGYELTDEELISQGIGIREGKNSGQCACKPLSPTTVCAEQSVERIIDGVKMQFVSAVGESDDQLFVWLEDDDAICSGDTYYGCWPNLYAIRGTPYRDAATWIDSLSRILSFRPAALLPGHTKALFGKDAIQEQLGTFRDAIEYVLLATLDCMDQGMSLRETAETVRLPERYAGRDFLGEYYGTVEWAVKSIFCGYVGWFDGKAEHLLPVSEKAYNQTLLKLIGTDKLHHEIDACMARGEYQLALQLLELTDRPEQRREALLQRAKQTTSANARHYLISAAKEMR